MAVSHLKAALARVRKRELYHRIVATCSAALLVYAFTKALSIPWWRDWEFGDGFDCTVLAGYSVWHLSKTMITNITFDIPTLVKDVQEAVRGDRP